MTENRKHQNLFIIGDTVDGQLSPSTRQIGPKARTLADRLDCRPVGVLFGHRIEAAAQRWSAMAGMSVIAVESEPCRYPNPAVIAAEATALAAAYRPAAFCFAHSMRACQAAAALSVKLAIPCITAVESITLRGVGVRVKRSLFGGRLTANLAIAALPAVLTVLPGAFSGVVPAARSDAGPSVEKRFGSAKDERCVTLGMERLASTENDLENSQVIVSGGRGLGEAGQVNELKKTAALFKNAAVGASRGACDLGWLAHGRQIGETGRTVAPALYLACGISGAPQHLAGMRDSQTIVAVNTDPHAAIRNVAHYAVEEDLKTFLPLLRKRYEETYTKGETDENR